jgi:hypothetical protein
MQPEETHEISQPDHVSRLKSLRARLDELRGDIADEPAAERSARFGPLKETDAEHEARLNDWENEQRADAEEHDGLVPFRNDLPPTGYVHHVRIPKPSCETPEKYVPPREAQDDAETELTALISECRFFMREISFHSARLACRAGERVQFVDTACRLAETGANIGKTVAKLRGTGTADAAEHIQRIIVERAERQVSKPLARKRKGGGGA